MTSPESVGAHAPLRGQTAVLTRAKGGIGRSILRAPARSNCRVLPGARDLDRANAPRQDIERAHSSTAIDCLPLALGSLGSVSRFAVAVRASVPRLEALILNAALVTTGREVTDDGFERQFAVNHLAGMLRASALPPSLRAAVRPTVAVVSSLASLDSAIDSDDPQNERSADRSVAYVRSTLANVMCAPATARREQDVTIVSLHPGVVQAGLLARLNRHDPVAPQRVVPLPSARPLPGVFFVDGMARATPASANAHDATKRLCTESERLIRAAAGRDGA